MRVTLFSLLILAQLSSCDDTDKKTLFFSAESPASGPGLLLTEAQISGNTLTLTITAKELTNVYGVATRLSFNPEVLQFDSFVPSAAWSGTERSIGVQRNGQVVIGITENGASDGNDFSYTAIGTLQFTILHNGSSSITFDHSKTHILDPSLIPIQGAVTGGNLIWK